MGKGRQRGATYCNEGVIELDDILRLKRRSSVGHGHSEHDAQPQELHAEVEGKRNPTQSIAKDVTSKQRNNMIKRPRHTKQPTPTLVSPRMSPVHSTNSDDEPRITLDLTVPTVQKKTSWNASCSLSHGDEDILAGCNALLSFSRGFQFRGKIGSAV